MPGNYKRNLLQYSTYLHHPCAAEKHLTSRIKSPNDWAHFRWWTLLWSSWSNFIQLPSYWSDIRCKTSEKHWTFLFCSLKYFNIQLLSEKLQMKLTYIWTFPKLSLLIHLILLDHFYWYMYLKETSSKANHKVHIHVHIHT